MLGSFPPQKKRWSMDFYYPNWGNDMWRITGLVFFNDRIISWIETKPSIKSALPTSAKKALPYSIQQRLCAVCKTMLPISFWVVQPTDIPNLLHRLPGCKAIVTTGEKATEVLCLQFSIEKPKVGDFTEFLFENRPMRLYRMPSSSRAIRLHWKSDTLSYYVSRPTDVISNFLRK